MQWAVDLLCPLAASQKHCCRPRSWGLIFQRCRRSRCFCVQKRLGLSALSAVWTFPRTIMAATPLLVPASGIAQQQHCRVSHEGSRAALTRTCPCIRSGRPASKQCAAACVAQSSLIAMRRRGQPTCDGCHGGSACLSAAACVRRRLPRHARARAMLACYHLHPMLPIHPYRTPLCIVSMSPNKPSAISSPTRPHDDSCALLCRLPAAPCICYK